MLTYHPAFDSYHCAYRTLLIATKMSRDVIEVERMRIWDFYFVFPKEASKMSMPKDLWSLKRTSIAPNAYEEITDPQRIFERMKPFQMAAYGYLAAFGFVEAEDLLGNNIVRTKKPVPGDLLSLMGRVDEARQYVLGLISSPLNDLQLRGDKGLKFRTRLLDFKYDAP